MLKTYKSPGNITRMAMTGGLLLLLLSPLHAHEQCNQCHWEEVPTEMQATLVQPLPLLCIDCHMERTGGSEHKINIIPAGTTGALPLVEGKLGCTTCHDPHSKQAKQLRVSQSTLCMTCHQY